MKKLLPLVALSFFFSSAKAHVVLDTPVATAGSYYRATLRVGHGCDASAIKQFVVKIPAGVQGAKPMPKAGWNIEIERTKLDKPYTSHGRTISEDVSEIRWTARTPEDYLQNAYYDEFVVFGKLPEAAGKLYWKASQICEQGRIDWHEVATAANTKPKSPAAVLEIKPKEGAHAHHTH